DVIVGFELKTVLSLTLPDGDPAQHAVVHVYGSAPGDRLGVDIQPREARLLLVSQQIRIGFGDTQFLQASLHTYREMALTLLVLRAKPVEETQIRLTGFVEHTRVDGCGKQVVRGGDGVDIAGQMEV